MMSGYKQTEVGVIPAGWKVWRLKDCCLKLNVSFVGICEPFYTQESVGVLMLRTGNLRGDRIILDDCKFVTREFHSRNKKSQVKTGDILIARHGNSGNAVLVPPEIDDVNALSIVILRTNEAILEKRFASYCINSDQVRSQAIGMLAGSTQVVINTREVEKLQLPVPPLPEQRSITEVLCDIDELISRLDKLIAKKRNLKQAVVQQLLTCQTRLPGFSGKWEVTCLNKIVQKSAGFWGAENRGPRHQNHVQVIRAGDISPHGELTATAPRYFSDHEYSKANCRAGDVVMTCSGSVGKVWWCDGSSEVVASNFVRILRPNPLQVDGRFLSELLRSASTQRLMTEHIATGVLANLGASFFNKNWVALPPLIEQRAIASILSEMDEALSALERRREKTRALKKGMMQELLTGKTRLI